LDYISSRKNGVAVHLKKLGADAAYRRVHSEFLCDGVKLLFDALSCGAQIKAVFTTDESELDEDLSEHGAKVYITPHDLIKSVSPLKNPQNVIFSCAMPEFDAPDPASSAIILDGIQDPGNLGTIIRTANAFEIQNVILTGGCADAFGPKAVRASMGAVFRQRVLRLDTEGIKMLKEKGMKLFAADLSDDAMTLGEPVLDGAVVIGSEGQGVSEEMLRICDMRIKIPMNPQSESLNAGIAAAIIMWEMYKNR
jgi:TrmH family RNA methyltransferase